MTEENENQENTENNNNNTNNNKVTPNEKPEDIETIYKHKLETQKNKYEQIIKEKEKEQKNNFSNILKVNSDLKNELKNVNILLESQISKNEYMRETYINLNCYDNLNLECDKTIFENIRALKANNEQKLQILEEENHSEILQAENTFQKNEMKIKGIILSSIQQEKNESENIIEDILNINKISQNKIIQLIENNYQKDKNAIILSEKYELMKEENEYLKNRIMIEKITLHEEIEKIQNESVNLHKECVNKILNEINDKKDSYFSLQFESKIDEISNYLTESLSANKTLIEEKSKIQNELNKLSEKFDLKSKENVELLEQIKTLTFKKEEKNIQDNLSNSKIMELNKELSVFKEKYKKLMKENVTLKTKKVEQNKENLNEEISASFAKELDLKQKINLIQQLNEKLTKLTNANYELKKQNENMKQDNDTFSKEINKYKKLYEDTQNEFIKYKNNIDQNQFNTKILNDNKEILNQINNLVNDRIFNSAQKKYLENEIKQLKQEIVDLKKGNKNIKKNNDLKEDKNNQLLEEPEYYTELLTKINQVYQTNFSEKHNNKNEIDMLEQINNKLINSVKTEYLNFPLNNPYNKLKHNTNLYKSVLLYIINLKMKYRADLFNAKNSTNTISTSINNQISIDSEKKKTITFQQSSDQLHSFIEETVNDLDKIIKQNVSLDNFQNYIFTVKKAYDDYIVRFFKKLCRYQTQNQNTVIFQMESETFNSLINEMNLFSSKIENDINKVINDYVGQSQKIEDALSILINTIERYE